MQLGGLEKRCKFLSGVWGRSQADIKCGAFSLIIWQLVASNLLIFPRIEAAEMSYRYFFVINSVLGLSNLFLRPCIVWLN